VAVTNGPDLPLTLGPILGWSDRGGGKADLLRRILASVSDPALPGGVVPVVDGAEIRFYACARTLALWERFRPILTAYVGVTITDFDGGITPPREGDPVADVLRAGGVELISVIRPRDGTARMAVDALVALVDTLRAAPPETEFAPRSTAQLLTLFRLAIAAEDRQTAEASIAVLREQMRLDAMNLAFLEVQLYASMGDWQGLRGRWFFDQLCNSRRTPRVTAALAETLYWCDIGPEIEDKDGHALVALFRERCLGTFGRLFTVVPPNPSTPVTIMFLLAAASGTVSDHATARSLVSGVLQPGTGPDLVRDIAIRLFGDAILAETPRQPPATGSTPALEEIIAGLEPGVAPTPAQARTAIRAAYALQSICAASRVIDAVRLLNGGQRAKLLGDRATAAIWDDLLAAAGGDAAPATWGAFLAAAPNMAYEEARRWAEAAVLEIPIASELDTPAGVADLITGLQRSFSESEVGFYAVLPHLLEWVRSDPGWPNIAYADLYSEILTLLILGRGRAGDVASAVGVLLNGLLGIGMSGLQYQQVLGELAAWLPTAVASRALDPLLDLADVVANNPCPSAEVRDRFWSSILAAISPHSGRLSPVQIAALQDLSRVLGGSEWVSALVPSASSADAEAAPLPRGFSIGLYTLMDSAGRRVQHALAVVHPEANVQLFTEHVASPRLVQAAEHADLFVVCWAAAKHSATEAIAAARPRRLPTVYPRGVGSASVLREVEDCLARMSVR
jgi:hypothetical protein